MSRDGTGSGDSVSLARVFLILLGAAALLGACEWDHYRRLIQWSSLHVTRADRCVLAWIICTKSVCLALPCLALDALLRRFISRRVAESIWLTSLSTIGAYLVIDLRVQATSGNHAWTYVTYLTDRSTWEWIGGAGGLATQCLLVVTLTTLTTVALNVIAHRLSVRCITRYPTAGQGRGVAASYAILTLLTWAVVPAHALVTRGQAVDRLHASLPCDPLAQFIDVTANPQLEQFRLTINDQLQRAFKNLAPQLTQAYEVDRHEIPITAAKPHVVLFVLESLRHDVWSSEMMPQLAAWAQTGLRLDRHYAGSNCSHLGVYGLLYSRSPLGYHPTLDANVPPQACVTFKQVGYECSYVACDTIQWMRMNEYIEGGGFDQVHIEDHDDWVGDDRRVLKHVREKLASAERPQFIVCFLSSTHCPYLYPDEFDQHGPVIPAETVSSTTIARREEVTNRYRNSVAFLDAEVSDTIRELDPNQHVIVVTGDHGESLFDDGTLSHWGRLSEFQCRTPLAIVGPGFESATVNTATTHADVLPTILHALCGEHVELAHTHGRDLLDETPADRVLLATMNQRGPLEQARHWEALLIDGQERLSLHISPRDGRIVARGCLDLDGKFDPQQSPPAERAEPFGRTVTAALERLVR